jgi:hypothetical protein
MLNVQPKTIAEALRFFLWIKGESLWATAFEYSEPDQNSLA